MAGEYIIQNPKVSVEKRPGPNYIKTPTSIRKEWTTAKGKKARGGVWYKNDEQSIPFKSSPPSL